MDDNGSKYVTYKDLITFQDKLFDALDRHSKKVIDIVDARLSDIVGKINAVEKKQKSCREEIAPVIEQSKSIKKLVWIVISSIVANIGFLVDYIFNRR